MIYEYFCEKCDKILESAHKMGKAPKSIKCKTCGTSCERYYGSMNFILRGQGWPSKSQSFNREMTERNESAGKKMKNRAGTTPKIKALDYGSGDVREV